MPSLTQLLDESALDLNDPRHKTWKRSLLRSYWNDAKCVIFSLAPQSFPVSISVMSLTTGPYQIAKCGTLLQVLDQTDKDGNSLGSALSSSATTYAGVYTGKVCASSVGTGAAFRLTGAQITAQRGNMFTVSPPVPADSTSFVRVLCSSAGPELTEDMANVGDLDCGYISAAIQWVRYRALSVDDASVASLAGAQLALATFKDLMVVRYGREMAQRFNMIATK